MKVTKCARGVWGRVPVGLVSNVTPTASVEIRDKAFER
jgi:hypothetical protein